jgi:DNA-binding beta-propeller fold protein YncE
VQAFAVVRASLASALAVAGAVLAWGAGVASATERGHAFGGSFGESGTGTGQLSGPSDVAVNEATGEVYVVDHGNNRVEIFTATGEYVGQFSGPEAPTGEFSGPTEIAIDNSCHLQKLTGSACKAADPSNEDVYVVDEGHLVVDKFSPRGEYLDQITEAPPAGRFETRVPGIAVAPDGTLLVAALKHGNPQDQAAFVYGDQLANVYSREISFDGLIGFIRDGLAVSGSGDIYVHELSFAGEQIAEVGPAGEALAFGLGGNEASGVAVEQSDADVYVDDTLAIERLSRAGEAIERLTVSGLGGAGLAVNAALGEVYVADPSRDVVVTFVLEPPGPPTVAGVTAANVTATSAELEARVNPRGATTTYEIEYGACASASTCEASGYEAAVPVPEKSAGSEFEADEARASAEGLRSHTNYHFKVIARNDAGGRENVAESEEGTFVTQAGGGMPELPDGRAWELVSPAEERGALIAAIGEQGVIEAAAGGNALTYLASTPTEASPKGFSNAVQVLSVRGTDGGWSSEDLATAHESATGKAVGLGQEYTFFSPDLMDAIAQPIGAFVPLSPGASEQTAYERTDLDSGSGGPCVEGCYRPLVAGCPEVGERCPAAIAALADVAPGTVFGASEEECVKDIKCGPRARAVSGEGADLHVVLESTAGLTPGAGADGGLYEWTGGALAFAGRRSASSVGSNEYTAVSADGSRVLFGSVNGSEPLTLDDPATSESVELDAKEVGCGACESGGAEQPSATPDGSRVFFLDKRPLMRTSDSTAGARDLYVCEVPEARAECKLTDLTSAREGGEKADALGILGTSEDGSWVYFAANGVLEGTAAQPGNCAEVEGLADERCNVYAVHRTEAGWSPPRLVTVLSGSDYPDWRSVATYHTSRVAPSGEWLAFMSARAVTGYDNRDAASGLPDEEVYLYDEQDNDVVCTSCNPTNERPHGVEYSSISGKLAGGDRVWPQQQWIAANVPGWTPYALEQASYQSRYLSDSGRLFFDSSDDLLPGTANGSENLFEYEPVGVGDCTAASFTFVERSGGCLSSISRVDTSGESAFLDASANGSDVFFLSSAELVPGVGDAVVRVYDAHECTAAAPCPQAAPQGPAACESSEGCRPSSAGEPIPYNALPTEALEGSGNLAPTPAAKPKPALNSIKPLTRAQRLALALKSCRRYRKRLKRRRCEAQARRRYGKRRT